MVFSVFVRHNIGNDMKTAVFEKDKHFPLYEIRSADILINRGETRNMNV